MRRGATFLGTIVVMVVCLIFITLCSMLQNKMNRSGDYSYGITVALSTIISVIITIINMVITYVM